MKRFFVIVMFAILPQVCYCQSYDVIGRSRSEVREIVINAGYYFISMTGPNNEFDTYYKYFRTYTVQLDIWYKDDKCVFFTHSGPTSDPGSMADYNSNVEMNKKVYSYNVKTGNYEKWYNGHLIVFSYQIAYEFKKWTMMFMKVL